MKQLDLNYMEAVRLWATGSAPKRLQEEGIDNVNDMLAQRKMSNTAQKLMSRFKSKGSSNGNDTV